MSFVKASTLVTSLVHHKRGKLAHVFIRGVVTVGGETHLIWRNKEIRDLNRGDGKKDQMVAFRFGCKGDLAELSRVVYGGAAIPDGGKLDKSEGHVMEGGKSSMAANLFVEFEEVRDLSNMYGGGKGIVGSFNAVVGTRQTTECGVIDSSRARHASGVQQVDVDGRAECGRPKEGKKDGTKNDKGTI